MDIDRVYKDADNLSPHDIDDRLDDYGYPIDADDGVIDYSELIEEEAFIGDTPYASIEEGINNQFNDYINYIHFEDDTDYVDIFYDQLHASRDAIDDEEDHPMEIKEALDNIENKFENLMFDLFRTRLTISISDVNIMNTEEDEIEQILRKLYSFFILNARKNFRIVITKDILPKIDLLADDDTYYRSIRNALSDYSPLITCLGADKFLEYCEENEILELYNEGKINGNFLRKYSCKLYQNEEFEVELISYITTVQNFKEDINNG